ncbi:uracil-DNA glycosylase family protein [Dinghuibacter silviterrae]|uniref:Uncharacterized protein DUF4918 n=1 Tax=Dinghuibacter silviterrae TaxID=1539049 RepID=A0A4R8DQN4_9BACT|nr:uracil-DNA glycosylase family protein [Dinghuibacter silviterrae]TDW99616.1 uncharacterized protein DUF4918 [Dinghuibacter silviterrae]
MALSTHILGFLRHLAWEGKLPKGVEVLYPFSDPEVWTVCEAFYKKFYAGGPRTLMIGINPGRFGAGTTGIPFTDPIRLKDPCGIDNPWPARQELSSVFMYEMIHACGGPEAFYGKVYITSVSPLGFTLDGKNLNYYDDTHLLKTIEPFAVDCLRKQLSWGMNTAVALCLGGGQNFKYLEKLNSRHHFFEKIVPLPHPRYIMQYRLKHKEAHIREYLDAFSAL